MKLEFKQIKASSEGTAARNTIVFIDYESLYISFQRQYAGAPMLDIIVEELKKNGRINKIKVFGDFTKPEIQRERNRIRTITSDIIDCGNESLINKKDHTDFIMLDHIYQEAYQNPAVEQFIICTGDGHFSSVATFLRMYMNKIVGVYGVYGSLSRQLKECSSWAKEINTIDDEDIVYQTNLLANLWRVEQAGKIATFHKTVEVAVRHYGGNENRYYQVLRDLLEQGYIHSVPCKVIEGKEINMLEADWEKINRELELSRRFGENVS